MSRSIYWKITLPLVVLVLVILSFLGFFMVDSVRSIQLENLRLNLVREARLVADNTLPYLDPLSMENIQALAQTSGDEIEARVTIISLDGTVLGDSWESPSQMENHSSRPEVQEALASGTGVSTRFSVTTGQTMMYVAVPIKYQGNTVGVSRVAWPLTAVNSSVNRAIRTIAWSLAAAALLVILATFFITRRITRPIRQATRAAMRISSGQFDRQIEIRSRDELGQLGRAFNRMSDNLQEMMASLAEERNKLFTVLATMADGVIMTDSAGKVLLANPAAGALFNFQVEKALDKPLIEVILNYQVEETVKQCLASGQKVNSQVDTTSGQFLRVLAVPLKTAKISGVLLLFQNLTELRSLQTLRREFVGNISHELRTPLAAIKAIVETLQDGAIQDSAVAQDFLIKVNAEVDSLTQMVNELIELSRIETGKTDLNFESLNLNEIAEETWRRLSPQAERKPVTLVSDLQKDLPPVQADRERIQQVFTNILHNAIKFTPPDGYIKIITRSAEDAVTVRISDTGIGISQKDIPRIFERFFKADKSRTGEGSGLGLAIAKHIIQAHHGKIWVESQEGKGSTFSFSIPVAHDK